MNTKACVRAWERLDPLEQKVMMLALHHLTDAQIALELFTRAKKVEVMRTKAVSELKPHVAVLEAYLQYVSPEVWDILQPSRLSRSMLDVISSFTENERCTAEWMASGKMELDIHGHGGEIENTLIGECRAIMQKLGISSRSHLKFLLDVHDNMDKPELFVSPPVNAGELPENNPPGV